MFIGDVEEGLHAEGKFSLDMCGCIECWLIIVEQGCTEQAQALFLPPHFIACNQAMILAMCQAHKVPDATQRSWLRCQYSYWALRAFARIKGEPTTQFWLSLILSFRYRHARSTIWAPSFVLIWQPVLGSL